MKSIGKSIALAAVFSVCGSYAAAAVFSINSARILQESREGRAVLAQNEKDRQNLIKLEQTESEKINKLRQEIEEGMRTGKLSQNQMQDKYEQLGRQQRSSKHVVEDAREDAKMREQRRVVGFRGKVFEVAGEFFKEKGAEAVLDKGTPGLIFVADSTDKTDDLLKELNVRHEKEKAKLALTKGNNKKA